MTRVFVCPGCRVTGELPDVEQQPRPGHFVVCESCTALLVFDEQMRLRHPVDDDLRELFRQARRQSAEESER